jgi:uncharacterized protein
MASNGPILIRASEDPNLILTTAKDFLASRPVLNNLILSLLEARVADPMPGRYWWASRNGAVAGVAFHSPPSYPIQLTPMETDTAVTMAEAIADSGVNPPGAAGEASTAACFAGQWTERRKSGATPIAGLRIYELEQLKEIGGVDGTLRRASSADRDLMVQWFREFGAEVHEPASDVERLVSTRLANGELWIWWAGAPKAMAVSVKPVALITRIGGVYTPPENRRRGYAAACVHGISKLERDAGHRCILYTDLGNPTSNSIYRKIGYRAVAEVLHYRFD